MLLNKIKDDYETECLRRLSRLENRELLNMHIRRTDYRDLYRMMKKSIDDPDDIEVIPDAHDLSLSLPGLILWTGDGAHIVHNRKIILDLTELCENRYLGERS